MMMLTSKWELLLHGDLRIMHRVGKVHCRYGQCFPVKGYESFWSVLAAKARLILKLDIYPKMQSANTPSSSLGSGRTSSGMFSFFETPLPEYDEILNWTACFSPLPRVEAPALPEKPDAYFSGWMRYIWSSESALCWKVTLCDDTTAATTVKLGDFKGWLNPIVIHELTHKSWVPRP